MDLLKENQNKISKYSLIIIVGIFLIFISALIFIHYYFSNEKKKVHDEEMVQEFFDIPIVEQNDEEIQEITYEHNDEQQYHEEINYIAVLEIPKINLKNGVFDTTNKDNNVDKNIYVVKETILPNENVDSHIILASHSGNSYTSYFRYLNQLDINDEVFFYYKGIKYIYKISDRYEVEKTGSVLLKQTNTSDITLITCIKGTNKQVVYVAYLIDSINY